MKSQELILQVIRKAAEVEVDMKGIGWPPDCEGFLCQRKRPNRIGKKSGKEKENV